MLLQIDPFALIFWIIFIIMLWIFGPRIMALHVLARMEKTAFKLEDMLAKGKGFIVRKIKKVEKKSEIEIKRAITSFLEFFAIEPVSLDPFGIIEKLEQIINLSENKMKNFVSKIGRNLEEEEKASLVSALAAAISLNQILKIIKHFIELVKKTRNFQLALIFQMQLPFIERIGKALFQGTEALTNGWPIGDSIGCLIVSKLIGNSKFLEKNETIICRKKIKGKNVILVKPKGPGGRIGKLGRVVEEIIKNEKISKLITIDAALKFEGEKTGSIAEGVGVAIGGIGTDKAFIENIALKKKILLDSFIIKMSAEESLQPMKREILNSCNKVIELVLKSIEETDGKTIVVGVGNTIGVGNSEKEAIKAEEKIKNVIKIMEKRRKAEKEKEKWSFLRFFEEL